MNDNRNHDRASGADDRELGAALGEAVGREADSPVTPPPVADIAERAEARSKARRVRHGVVGIAAAAALTAGLVTWNTLNGDGGNGNIQVATQPTVPEPTASRSDEAAQPDSGKPMDPATKAGATPAPAGTDEPAATNDPAANDPDVARLLPAPTELSTGPALNWAEVSVDLGEQRTDSVELESLGDGRILALIRSESGDRVAITSDGATWTAVAMPGGVQPRHISVDADRWLIALSGSAEDGDPGRVLVSEDGGGTWNDVALEVPSATALPTHCVERLAVQDVLLSGDRTVVLMSLHRFLDIEAVLVERGLVAEGTLAHEWRRTDDVLTIRLGDPDSWGSGDDGFLNVTLDELELTPEQLGDCDEYASGRVRVYAGDTASVAHVVEFDGWARSAVATRDGFALVVTNDTEVRRLTSPDGRRWTAIPTTEAPNAVVARGSGGTVWLGENGSGAGYRIRRGDIATEPQIVATFDVVQPVGLLSAGPAGVATTAWAIPDALAESIGTASFTKDGYELRMGESGAVVLWDLSEDVAVYEFSADDLSSDQPPEGVQELTGDDGSLTVVFSDPVTGDELVRFYDSEMVPDTDQIVATRLEMFGPLGMPPIWLGWSAAGDRWGWQDAADAFGLATEEGLAAVQVAVGSDLVLALVATYEVAEVLAMVQATESAGQSANGSQPPTSWRIRWFIAEVP